MRQCLPPRLGNLHPRDLRRLVASATHDSAWRLSPVDRKENAGPLLSDVAFNERPGRRWFETARRGLIDAPPLGAAHMTRPPDIINWIASVPAERVAAMIKAQTGAPLPYTLPRVQRDRISRGSQDGAGTASEGISPAA